MEKIRKITMTLGRFFAFVGNIKSYMIPPALSFGVLSVMWYINRVDFTLKRFTDRAIGIAILLGIDPAKRQDVYFLSMLVFVAVFFSVIFILSLFEKNISTKKIEQHFKFDKTLLSELSMLLLVNLALAVVNFNNNSRAIIIPIFIIFVLILHNILKLADLLNLRNRVVQKFQFLNSFLTKPNTLALISRPEFVFFTIIVPIPFLYFLQLLPGRDDTVNIFSPLNGFIYIALYMVFRTAMKYMDIKKVAMASIPLCCIPLSIIFSNELQYTLLKYHSFSPKSIALFLSLLLIGISVLIYSLKKNYSKTNAAKIIQNVFFPIILVTMVGYISHRHFYTSRSYDLLHQGNRIVPVQQLLEFGKIPFLDYWGAQELPIGGILYSLFNGFNQLEPMLWHDFFNMGVVVLIGYYSLKGIFHSRWTFLAFLFLPLLQFTQPYYAAALLPMAYLKKLLKNRRLLDYIVFLLMALLPFVWMASAGKISIISAIVLLVLSCTSKDDIVKMIKSSAIVFGSAVFMYCILTLLRGESIIDKLILIKAFSSVEFSIGSYPSIIGNNPLWEIVLTYGLFPLVSLLSIIYVLSRKSKSYKEYVVLFLATANLIASIRTLARHSLVEGFFHMFVVILIFAIIFYIKRLSEFSRYALFSGLSLFFILFVPVYDSYVNRSYSGLKLIEGVKPFEFKQFMAGEDRYIANKGALPNNLIKFMDNYLEEDQTFFEMINAHLLYTFTRKEAPFLHHAVHIIYSEPSQIVYIKQFEKKYNDKKIPVVIFDGPWWGKVIDGIPTEFSAFKLTEFIYKNYKPWIIVDGYHLWLANNSELRYNDFFEMEDIITLDVGDDLQFQREGTVLQNFNLTRLPYIWANYDNKILRNKPQTLKILGNTIIVKNETIIPFDDDIDKSNGNYIYLKIRSESKNNSPMTISYGEDNSISFTVLPGTQEYLLRISSQYKWVSEKINEFNITASSPMIIEQISVLRGD